MSAYPNQAGLRRWAPTTLVRATATARAASAIGWGVFVRPHTVNKAQRWEASKTAYRFFTSCISHSEVRQWCHQAMCHGHFFQLWHWQDSVFYIVAAAADNFRIYEFCSSIGSWWYISHNIWTGRRQDIETFVLGIKQDHILWQGNAEHSSPATKWRPLPDCMHITQSLYSLLHLCSFIITF